jgi:hypothetical protein
MSEPRRLGLKAENNSETVERGNQCENGGVETFTSGREAWGWLLGGVKPVAAVQFLSAPTTLLPAHIILYSARKYQVDRWGWFTTQPYGSRAGRNHHHTPASV